MTKQTIFMPKAKTKRQRFNTEKDVNEGTAVDKAPIVGGEFVTKDGDWQGQTVQVQSDKHLEDDLGTGDPVVLRTYGFGVNLEMFARRTPTFQEVFDSHKRGIAAMLWTDGLTPMEEVEPRIFFNKDRTQYFITVAAKPQVGQAVLDTTRTLSQIAHEGRTNPNQVHRGL